MISIFNSEEAIQGYFAKYRDSMYGSKEHFLECVEMQKKDSKRGIYKDLIEYSKKKQ